MVTRMTGGTFFVVPNDLLTQLASLSGAATKVYLVLRSHMNQATGESFPSYEQIQEIAGIQSASVAKAVRELQAAGLVEVRKQGRRSFYHFTNQSTSETEPVRKVKDTSSVIEVKPLQKPNSNKTKINKTNLTRPDANASDYSAPFDAFWIAYGRKGSKQTAWKEWQRHVAAGAVAAIMAAVPVYLATRRVREGYKLDAERFLSRRVWENPTLGEENERTPPKAENGGVSGVLDSVDRVLMARDRFKNGASSERRDIPGMHGTDQGGLSPVKARVQ